MNTNTPTSKKEKAPVINSVPISASPESKRSIPEKIQMKNKGLQEILLHIKKLCQK